MAANALVVGTCESACDDNSCPNNLVCRPRRWTRQCDNCGGDNGFGGGRGMGAEYGPTVL